MERIILTNLNVQEAVARAAAVLRGGGVILYPTDTLYGLGADAFSDAAVAKIYDIKKRDEKKPIHCIVADMAMAEQFGELDERARTLADTFLPGPLTIVVRKKTDVTTGIGAGITTLGIRIPENDFCLALARRFGKPYTTTSANVSSAPQQRRLEEILAQLGENARLIDLVIDAGELPVRLPSTIVDVSSQKIEILREGMISTSRINQALGI